MKLRERLVARLRTLVGTEDAAAIEGLAESYTNRIVDLVERLNLREKRLHKALLDRPALAEQWPINDLGPNRDQIPEFLRWAVVAHGNDNQLPSWPADIAQADIADLIEGSNDEAAAPLVKALRAQWFFPREGLITVSESAYHLEHDKFHVFSERKTPWGYQPRLQAPLEAALARYPLNECLLIQSIISNDISRGRTRSMIPIPTSSPSRTAMAALSQSSSGPWISELAEWTDSRVELVWDGKPQAVQFAFDIPGFEPALLKGILDELHEDGLRDVLCLHRMAAEQGRAGSLTWTWTEHRERTSYARRIGQKNLSDAEAAQAVTGRLWRLKRCEIRQQRKKPDGKVGWVRIGPFGYIDIPAGLNASDKSLERARIIHNPVLYGGSHRDSIDKHFTLVHEEVLTLDGKTLRLAALIAFDFRYARDRGGLIRRSAKTLWEYGNIYDGRPERRRWPEAEEMLQKKLERLEGLAVIGPWRRSPGPDSPETIYEIHPSAAWRDQVVHDVPPELPPSTAHLPRTGGELRVWRQGQQLSQAALSRIAGVGVATVKREEANPSKGLGPTMMKALVALAGRRGTTSPLVSER